MTQSLTVTDLTVKVGKKTLVDQASLTVARGEIVGLIGPNGAGKTSLMRATVGVMDAQSGRVSVEGDDLTSMQASERAKKISYLPQGAKAHWPLKVDRLIALGRLPHLGPWQDMQEDDDAQVIAAMEATDCLHLKDRLVTQLSGGERALVLLARAVAVGAPYMMVDEPTASLDPYHQLQVMDLLKGICQRGAGVLVTLHDLSLAARFCDRILLMKEGSLIAEGPASEVLTKENLASVYRISGTVDTKHFDRL